jgi:hypothetical protein
LAFGVHLIDSVSLAENLMPEKARQILKDRFSDGQRPSGSDFTDLIDSVVNKQSDNVSTDSSGNLLLTGGVRLGDSNLTAPGGLRFNSNQLQVFTGGAWTNVSGGGGGGGFGLPTTLPATPVAHDGNVGIGPFAAPPTFRLEVPLGNSGTAADQVRFGNVVCGNGAGLSFQNTAVIAHQQQASANINANFALRQMPQAQGGAVHLNAPANQVVSIRQGGVSVRLGVSPTGNVVVGDEQNLAGAPAAAVFQVSGAAFIADTLQIAPTGAAPPNQVRLIVNGDAAKVGGGAWGAVSDARVKKDVRDLEAGLAELREVRPVRFRYNGAAGTPDGMEGVGVIAQEVEMVLPETVRRLPGEHGLEDLRIFDASPLTFMLINAVKELAARVEHLEQALAAATVGASDTGSVVV